MYFTIIVGVCIAFGAEADPARLPVLSPVFALCMTILLVALAPAPGMLLAATIRPQQLAESFTRAKILRRVRIGSLLCQLYLLASFAVVTYVLDWPLLVEGVLRMRGFVLIDDLMRLTPFIAMLVLALVPLYRIDRMLRGGTWSMREYIEFHLRHELLFILAPVIVMVTVSDVLGLLSGGEWLRRTGLDWLVSVAAMAVLYLFSPFLLRFIWKTRPMEEGPVRRSLDGLCTRAKLRTRDFLVWETMGGHVVNACVAGVIGPVRYILVTDALMESLPPDEMAGVFGHEIGHAKLHHIAYYLLLTLVFFGSMVMIIGSMSALGAASEWAMASVVSLQGLALTTLVVLYWGAVFGFVSRRMEMEADVYAVRLTGNTQSFVDALERISFFSGRSRSAGSWRHFSIARRTGFLKGCEEDPALLKRFTTVVFLLRAGIIVFAVLSAAGAAFTLLSREKEQRSSPEVSCGLDVASGPEHDGSLRAHAPAGAAAETPLRIDLDLLPGGAVTHRSELADAHAGPAAGASVAVRLGDVLGPEHHPQRVPHRRTHRHAVRPVTVADTADERCNERPDRVTEPLTFVAAHQLQRLFPGDVLHPRPVRPLEEASVNVLEHVPEDAAARPHADSEAVACIDALRRVAADAGHAHDGVREAEDALDVLDGNHLAEVELLHLP
jgi:Zn-dependent protease with chaperone function